MKFEIFQSIFGNADNEMSVDIKFRPKKLFENYSKIEICSFLK